MKVGFDVGPLMPRPAGVGIYVRSLASAIVGQFPREDLTFLGKRPDAEGLPAQIDTIDRDPGQSYPAWALLNAGGVATGAGVDILHMTDGLVPLIRKHGRTVVTVLDMTLVERPMDHRIPRYLRIPFILAAPRLAAQVLVPSQATARSVRRLTGTSHRRIHVVPLAAREGFKPATADAAREVSARHGLVPGQFILVPGTIEPRKNPLGTLRAFERLAAERRIDPEVRLAFAGSMGWRLGKFPSAVDESRFAERVDVLGYVGDSDLPALMTAAAVVAYPSFAEGFGFPVVEAMACGAIVVTSDRSSLPEVAGDAAQLVDPSDIGSIADALHLAVTLSSSDRDAASKASIARASTFSWGITAARSMEAWAS